MQDVSLEELLAKIEEIEKGGKESPSSFDQEKKAPRSITDFIKTFEIKDGTDKIPTYKVFYDYISWERFSSTKLSKIEFGRQFKKFFESGRGNRGRFYYLDAESFDVSNESLTRAKKYDTMYQGKKVKK